MPYEGPANLFADPALLSLADMINRLADASALGERERRDIRSAAYSLAVWLHRTPAEIPAHPAFLRQAFKQLRPAALGISKGRLQNVRSLLKRGLAVTGITQGSATWLAPLSPDWQALYDRITDSYARELLSRFPRFCTRQGISPAEVDDATALAFQAALEAEDLTAKPFIAAQSAVRLWNRMVTTVPGWPQRHLSPLRRAERYTLTWNQLPAAFAADAARYLALQAGADLTDPLAPPRALKPLSLSTRRYQIQQLVSALHRQGVDIRCFSSLADLCRPAYVRLALQYFITRLKDRKGPDAKPDTAMISGLAHTLKVIAKHYVQIEPAALEEITRIAGRLRRRPRGMTEKNQQRLTQLYDPQLLWRFVTFAREEMAKLADQRAPARLDAVRYSTLLAIELLTVAPMRVHNLTGLDLNRHFNRPTGRKRSPIRLTIPRDEVKNDQPLDYVLPDDTAAFLHIYLDRFRPLLVCQPSSALFPSYKEGPKRSDTMSKQISRLLRKELGLDWNPHLFRHFAAKIKLQANPGDYEGTRRLLAHSSIETTARIYAGNEMRSAVEHYDRLIEEIRGPAPISPAPRRR